MLSKIKGFTLYEVMVTTSIIAILSAISFYGLSTYADYFTLKEASRGIDSLLRTTQGYAINVQNIDGNDQFLGRYGLHFSTDNNTKTTLFADSDENFLYQDSESIEETVLGRGIVLNKICYTTTLNTTEQCTVSNFDVVFVRPKTDANIRINNGTVAGIKEVRLEYLSPKGRISNVTIGATGYIMSN